MSIRTIFLASAVALLTVSFPALSRQCSLAPELTADRCAAAATAESALRNISDSAKAIAEARNIAGMCPSAKRWAKLGRLYEADGRWDEAFDAYMQAYCLTSMDKRTEVATVLSLLLEPLTRTGRYEALQLYTLQLRVLLKELDAQAVAGDPPPSQNVRARWEAGERALAELSPSSLGIRKVVSSAKDVGVEPMLELRVSFDYDKDSLTDEGRKQVAEVTKQLADMPVAGSGKIWLIGHTDTRGGDKYNDDLSLRRAKRVQAELLGGLRDKGWDVRALGWGKRNPVFANAASEADHRVNRRVELRISDTTPTLGATESAAR